jgi:hypothetical protein
VTPLVARRVARAAATRSPYIALAAVQRELRWWRADRGLARAAGRGERILAGPFLGEVGYELLYWIPFLRRLLQEHEVEPERVTVLTRGGAAIWYSDFAADAVEILDLVDPATYADVVEARRRRERHAKQYVVDPLDRALVESARERVGDAYLVHPLLMFSRFRFVWEGLLPPEDALRFGQYRHLDPPSAELDLPERFTAVKLYFSESLPDFPETRRRLTEIVSRLGEVVVLANRSRVDEHDEWVPAGAPAPVLEPRTNLAVQTAIVARAERLVCTYGGFAYLGPLLGVPTLALHAKEVFNPNHVSVARAAFPDATLDVVSTESALAALHAA